MDIYAFTPGTTPLLVSMPIADLAAAGPAAAPDRRGAGAARHDWHVDRLYDFARGLGAGILRATHSRYVIDLNRPPTTGRSIRGEQYRAGADDLVRRRASIAPARRPTRPRSPSAWRAIGGPITSGSRPSSPPASRFDVALLFDAHSIRSVVPRFFPGRLPDLNLGSRRRPDAAPPI